MNEHSDIRLQKWMIRALPERWKPYAVLARLDRPIGVWLLVLPGWWSIILASEGVRGLDVWAWVILILFGVGAVVMRAAGCVVNDLWDRNIDKKVERTRNRPLASGVISPKEGLLFLAVLLMVGALILLSMNWTTITLGLVSVPLIVAYPLMKRITFWPQLFLGITFNFSALMGWSAITGEVGIAPILLYIGGLFWTIGYDTIYAHQDKEDDLIAGVKSTALLFEEYPKVWVGAFYLIAFICFALPVLFSEDRLWALLLLPALHMGWQVLTWKPQDPESSLSIFKSNRDLGFLLLLIMAI